MARLHLRVSQSLNWQLDAELGGTLVDGHLWSQRLEHPPQEPPPPTQASAALGTRHHSAPSTLLDGARLRAIESASSVEIGSGRALGLLRCLGELYEHSHDILRGYPTACGGELAGVWGMLLRGFPWLGQAVRVEAQAQRLHEIPAVRSALGEANTALLGSGARRFAANLVSC